MTNKEYAASLRRLADVYDRNDKIPQYPRTAVIYCDTEEQFKEVVKELRCVC